MILTVSSPYPPSSIPSPPGPEPLKGVLQQCSSVLEVALSPLPPQGRSRSLYFLRRMETWSLKSTGSSRTWECTSGM